MTDGRYVIKSILQFTNEYGNLKQQQQHKIAIHTNGKRNYEYKCALIADQKKSCVGRAHNDNLDPHIIIITF